MALIYEEQSYAILGACFEVYSAMGSGFLESVYQECLSLEFAARGVPFVARLPLQLSYKQQPLTQQFQPDFVCYEQIVVEIKAVRDLADSHRAQLHNYLKATGLQLGMLINFGHSPRLAFERVIRSADTAPCI